MTFSTAMSSQERDARVMLLASQAIDAQARTAACELYEKVQTALQEGKADLVHVTLSCHLGTMLALVDYAHHPDHTPAG